jgi:hypothetical protein
MVYLALIVVHYEQLSTYLEIAANPHVLLYGFPDLLGYTPLYELLPKPPLSCIRIVLM